MLEHDGGQAVMISELQWIVNSLGRRLNRSVSIHSPDRLLHAYSPHSAEVDDKRLRSILERRAPADAASWVFSFGVNDSERPVRIPANPRLKMLPRVCGAIRHRGMLLGHISLIDANESLTEQDIDTIQEAADSAGEVMYRMSQERMVEESERSRERAWLQELLSDEADVRARAAEELTTSGLFIQPVAVAVLVVEALSTQGQPLDQPVQSTMELAFDRARYVMRRRHSLQLVRADHGVFVAGKSEMPLSSNEFLSIGKMLRDSVTRALSEARGWQVFVGIADVAAPLSDAVHTGYRQARQAARVARTVPEFPSVALWSQLGVYRTLSHFPTDRLPTESLHPGLVKLFEDDSKDWLAETLERYLDLGCDAQATARDIGLHRASLYYRLQKIEQIADVDLHNGEDRLALHLGLKLARLGNLHRFRSPGSQAHVGERNGHHEVAPERFRGAEAAMVRALSSAERKAGVVATR